MATPEDALSQGSIESTSTGDEYVVVNGEPKLRITGDVNDIRDAMSETSSTSGASGDPKSVSQSESRSASHVIPTSQSEGRNVSHVIPTSQSVGVLAGEERVQGEAGMMIEDQNGQGKIVIFIIFFFLLCEIEN